MELLPNLFWIEGQRSNIYLWKEEGSLILVDTGLPGDAELIVETVQDIGYQLSDIKAILITHADADHAGSAAALQTRTGATLYAGSETVELLRLGKSPKHLPRLVQFIVDRFSSYEPVPVETMLIVEDGELASDLGDWQALATPGHTLDHHSYCSKVNGILFAGDALNTRGDRLQLMSKTINADQEAARQSAMRLLQLHPALIACGHGRPMQNHNADDMISLYREIDRQASD